jgi:ribosomal protein S18 acetylase RimI-like enzyme
MTVQLKNSQTVNFRLLEKEDEHSLHQYLGNLSPESLSRFGPHPFDNRTVEEICNNLPGDTFRFIAEDKTRNIVAYMLVKRGFIDADQKRFHQLNIFLADGITATYAPSVADAWQNSGLGTSLFHYILKHVKNSGYKYLVLWGGVQAQNERAVHFYDKHDFKKAGTFWHDGKDNLDMFLEL